MGIHKNDLLVTRASKWNAYYNYSLLLASSNMTGNRSVRSGLVWRLGLAILLFPVLSRADCWENDSETSGKMASRYARFCVGFLFEVDMEYGTTGVGEIQLT